MSRVSSLVLMAAAATSLLVSANMLAQQPRPNFQITQIKDNLYRSGNGAWHSIFLVTDEGILFADPLNVAHATWLKNELATRFNKPVKYLVYSHSHWDHVEGGASFEDTATIIAYEGMRANFDGRYPNMPGDMVDRNGNGNIDREDIMIPTEADPGICGMFNGFFEQVDRNKDGTATPAEFQQDIAKPDQYYSGKTTITIGGETVELIHPGKNHGDDMTVLYFPKQRVVFAADMIADALVREDIRSLPSACGPFDGHPMDEWIDSYKAVYALDFDTFAGGHGAFFTKADIALPMQFLEDLKAAVSKGIADGLTLEQMKQRITLEQYKDWAYYDRLREKNIEAAYRNLTMFK